MKTTVDEWLRFDSNENLVDLYEFEWNLHISKMDWNGLDLEWIPYAICMLWPSLNLASGNVVEVFFSFGERQRKPKTNNANNKNKTDDNDKNCERKNKQYTI